MSDMSYGMTWRDEKLPQIFLLFSLGYETSVCVCNVHKKITITKFLSRKFIHYVALL